MKKTIFILLFINSFLSADYLLKYTTKSKVSTFCIKSYLFYDKYMYYKDSNDDKYYNIDLNNITNYEILSGYYSSNGICIKFNRPTSDFESDKTKDLTSENLTYLGLSDNDLSLAFALSGIFLSILFLYGLFRWI